MPRRSPQDGDGSSDVLCRNEGRCAACGCRPLTPAACYTTMLYIVAARITHTSVQLGTRAPTRRLTQPTRDDCHTTMFYIVASPNTPRRATPLPRSRPNASPAAPAHPSQLTTSACYTTMLYIVVPLPITHSPAPSRTHRTARLLPQLTSSAHDTTMLCIVADLAAVSCLWRLVPCALDGVRCAECAARTDDFRSELASGGVAGYLAVSWPFCIGRFTSYIDSSAPTTSPLTTPPNSLLWPPGRSARGRLVPLSAAEEMTA